MIALLSFFDLVELDGAIFSETAVFLARSESVHEQARHSARACLFGSFGACCCFGLLLPLGAVNKHDHTRKGTV